MDACPMDISHPPYLRRDILVEEEKISEIIIIIY